jgi:hypothetical protein
MTSTARPNVGRRLRLAVAGAAVVTTLSVASAGASPPTPMGDATPMGVQVAAMTRPRARPGQDPAASSPAPGFLRDAKGGLTAINRPGTTVTAPFDINNRGQIVGVAGNPEDQAGAPSTGTAPMAGRS